MSESGSQETTEELEDTSADVENDDSQSENQDRAEDATDMDDERDDEKDLGLEEKLEAVEKERDEFKEKYLRKVADLDNLRKRKQEEIQEYKKYASKSILEDLLEVLDNFDRAMESMDFESEDVHEGVELIYDQLSEIIQKEAVEPIKAEGEPFDPHLHEGMMQEERNDLDEQIVLDVFKKGYKLHDRVLRPAQVKVGIPVSSDDEDESIDN